MKSVKNVYSNDRLKFVLPFILIFIVFFLSRIALLQRVVLLEDMDSISYLRTIKVFLSMNFNHIYNLDPDSSIFYPALGALFSLPGWSVETGARLASLFAQCVLFFSIMVIGLRIGTRSDVILGLLLFTFTPALLELSVSVLTEPTYVALIYLALFLLWSQFSNPKLWMAAVIGSLVGIAFLTRLEGIIYLGVFPVFILVYITGFKSSKIPIKQYGLWVLVFWFFASLFIIPQIYRVSDQMNTLAVNGRQAWTVLLHSDENKSYEELIYGLDYSPEEVNIDYLKENMDRFSNLDTKQESTESFVKNYIVTAALNFFDLNDSKLPEFFGIFVLVFFVFGLFSLFQKGYIFEILLVLLFLTSSLIPPMLHNVIIRHIIIIGPLVLLIAGFGIMFISNNILENIRDPKVLKYLVPLILLLIAISPWIYTIKNDFNPPKYRKDYSLVQLQKPVEIIKEISQKELDRQPVIASRLSYIGYYAGADLIFTPYTNYEGLVKYLTLNKADFLYLNYYYNDYKNRKYPFMTKFVEGDTSDNFILLYNDIDKYTGAKLELYRFKKSKNYASHP